MLYHTYYWGVKLKLKYNKKYNVHNLHTAFAHCICTRHLYAYVQNRPSFLQLHMPVLQPIVQLHAIIREIEAELAKHLYKQLLDRICDFSPPIHNLEDLSLYQATVDHKLWSIIRLRWAIIFIFWLKTM